MALAVQCLAAQWQCSAAAGSVNALPGNVLGSGSAVPDTPWHEVGNSVEHFRWGG